MYTFPVLVFSTSSLSEAEWPALAEQRNPTIVNVASNLFMLLSISRFLLVLEHKNRKIASNYYE